MSVNGFDAEKGFIGPNGLKEYNSEKITVVADNTVKDMKNFVIGINQKDKHGVGYNWGVEVQIPSIITDIRLTEAGEFCPQCGQPLKVTRGIEVGNIFQLGTKYSKPMNAVYLDSNGKAQPYIMGCYGIGISRTAAAAVEAHHDEFGIKWPLAIAPYHAIVIPVNVKDELQLKVAEDIYKTLTKHGVEAVIDDRDERAGVKFKDAELIGFPYIITVGRGIVEVGCCSFYCYVHGLVEFKTRETNEKSEIKPEDAAEIVITAVHNLK